MSKRTGEELINPKVKKNWASDGVDPRSEYFTPRVKVFEFLEGQIRDKSKGAIPYLLLRAPYASGKTALMQASHKYFQDSFTVISVTMLCSSNCTNENFSAWLLEKANIGPERVLHSDTTITSFFSLLKQGVFPKPVLLWFDEVQKIYDAPYAVSFLDHLKRIVSEHSSWNVEAIIFSGIYEDFVTGRSSPADITKRFGVDVLYFRPEEIKELIQDFNDNHLTFHIDENIVEPLHTATGGHPGFVVKCLASIEEHYIKEGVRFGIEDWVSWRTRHYKDALNSSRTAQQLAEIYKNNENWRDIVKQLFRREPAKLDMTNELSMYFIKSGLICQAPGMLDSFNFGSPAVRLLLLEALLGPMLKERPTDKWFKNLIDILTVAVPLMDSQLIKSCLSTTVKNRKETWKESVWQNHFFAALYGIIPLDYCIDPEYSVKGGRVDYRITGEDFFGAVELLISESDQDKGTTESTENYILEHYYRFVKDPNGAFKHKYPELSKNFIVVNITHVKPKITIPGKLPLTYADLVFDDKLENITLYIDNYTIPLTMGDPILWDKQTNKSEAFEIRNYTDKFIEEESWQLNVDIKWIEDTHFYQSKIKDTIT